MASYSGTVTAGTMDWQVEFVGVDTTASTLTTIQAYRQRDLADGSLLSNEVAYANVDTSGLEDSWSITAATLHWYTESHVKTPKGDSFGSSISMRDTSGTWQTIDTSSADRADGWDSVALTETERGWINTTGVTQFNWQMDNSDTWGSQRSWTIRAYEYTNPSGTNSAYLLVEYDVPAPVRRSRFIITG